MTILKILKSYLLSLFIFLLMDAVWLGFIAKELYQKELGALLGPVRWGPALLFYLLYLSGVLYFAILPALEKNSYFQALINGAFFGLIAYATYDLTNLATLKDWPLKIVIYDLLWGLFITAITSTSTFFIMKKR